MVPITRRVGERRLKEERTLKHAREETGIKREVSLERVSISAAGTVGALTFTPRVYIPSRGLFPRGVPSLPSNFAILARTFDSRRRDR